MEYMKKQGLFEDEDLSGGGWEFDDIQKEVRRVEMVKKDADYDDFKKGEKIEVQTDFGIFIGTILEVSEQNYKILLDSTNREITISKEDRQNISSCLENDKREMKIELNELYSDDIILKNDCIVLGREIDDGYKMIKISMDGNNYILTYDSCSETELDRLDITPKSYLKIVFAKEDTICDKQEIFETASKLVNYVFDQEEIF